MRRSSAVVIRPKQNNLKVEQSANVTHAGDLVCVPDDGELGREMGAVRGALDKSGRKADVMAKRSSDYPM